MEMKRKVRDGEAFFGLGPRHVNVRAISTPGMNHSTERPVHVASNPEYPSGISDAILSETLREETVYFLFGEVNVLFRRVQLGVPKIRKCAFGNPLQTANQVFPTGHSPSGSHLEKSASNRQHSGAFFFKHSRATRTRRA